MSSHGLSSEIWDTPPPLWREGGSRFHYRHQAKYLLIKHLIYLLLANCSQVAATCTQSGHHTHSLTILGKPTKSTTCKYTIPSFYIIHEKKQYIQFFLCANKQETNNFIRFCMHVAATYVQFVCNWWLNGREYCMSGC